jgi:hypothetical protein
MPVLKLKRHETFARNIGIKGMSAAEAYRTGWPKASKKTAEHEGPRLAQNPKVATRISEFREESAKRAAEKDFLTVEEKRAFCARIVRTPVGQVDHTSDLCQERTYTEGQEETSVRVKMPCKLKAILIDNDFAVDGASAGASKALEIIIRRL